MIEEFFLRFLGVLIGALPFIVLGVGLATVIQIYSRPHWYEWIFRTNFIVSHIMIGLVGLLIPICECGNIPVIKKLLDKNFSFSHAVTFLLAAPIVNPVTILTTYQAFKDYPALIFLRIGGGFIIALSIGLLFSLNKDNLQFLKFVIPDGKSFDSFNTKSKTLELTKPVKQSKDDLNNRGELFIENSDECSILPQVSRIAHVQNFAASYCVEFVGTMKFLILGSFLSAAFQILIPLQWIEFISQNPISSLFALMLFGFIISVCSNVDAFIGLSFINNFSINSILGFLVFGPMIDIKTIIMLKSIYTTRFIVLITFLALSSTTLLVSTYYVANIFHIL